MWGGVGTVSTHPMGRSGTGPPSPPASGCLHLLTLRAALTASITKGLGGDGTGGCGFGSNENESHQESLRVWISVPGSSVLVYCIGDRDVFFLQKGWLCLPVLTAALDVSALSSFNIYTDLL